jgi:hypothetical protein
VTVGNWDMTPRGRRNNASTTNALPAGDTYATLTRDKMRSVLDAIGRESVDDPLNGATTLWVATGDDEAADAAEKLREASGDRLIVQSSPNGFPGRIYGFNKTYLPCVVIKMKES